MDQFITFLSWLQDYSAAIQGIVATVGLIVAVAAMVATRKQAVFNGQQIEQNRILLYAELYNQSVTYSVEISKILLDKPKLRKYIYDNYDIDRSHEDYPRFASLAEVILDLFDTAVKSAEIRDSRGRSNWPGPQEWRNWMVDIASTSPGLRRHFELHENWYIETPQLREIFEEGKRKAQERVGLAAT